MSRKPLSRSKRQYAHIHNGPAQQLARGLPAAKGLPMPGYELCGILGDEAIRRRGLPALG